MNPAQELLQFLDQSGPGVNVVITGELARIFPPPSLRFRYAEYAAKIRSFLCELEREGLIRVEIPNKELFETRFGDLNNVFCNLENHEILGAITKEGAVYLAGLVLRGGAGMGGGSRFNRVVDFLKGLAEAFGSVKKIVVVVVFLLGLWGGRMVLSRSKARSAAPAVTPGVVPVEGRHGLADSSVKKLGR